MGEPVTITPDAPAAQAPAVTITPDAPPGIMDRIRAAAHGNAPAHVTTPGDFALGTAEGIAKVSAPAIAYRMYQKFSGQDPNALKTLPAEAGQAMALSLADVPPEGGRPMGTGAVDEALSKTPKPSLPAAVPPAAQSLASRLLRRVPYLGKVLEFKDLVNEVSEALRPEAPKPAAATEVPTQFSPQPAPSPYRLGPGQVPSAVTVTPREVFRPAGLLPERSGMGAPPPVAPTAERMAAESPAGATVESVQSTVPRTYSGESVLNQALTGLDSKTLLKIARSRGIDVSAEAQLRPGLADARVIKKIIDNFSEDELDGVRSQGAEVSRFRPQAVDISDSAKARDLWHVKVLQTYFPEVSIPKSTLARAEFALNQMKATSTQAPASAAGDLVKQLEDSLKQAKARK